MTNQQHPITPPPELVEQWIDFQEFTAAARWGADQELKACIEWVSIQLNCTGQEHLVPHLRAARRPQPPSLKEQALEALDMHFAAIGEGQCCQAAHKDTIRRALEQLDD